MATDLTPHATNAQKSSYDAVVVGAGPNGLAAAITLARAGRSVLVLEARESIGGGARSAELTLPGFVHDVCSAIHPLGVASPFFQSAPLGEFGLEWVYPDAGAAQPLPDGAAAVAYRSLDQTAETLGADGGAYKRLLAPFVRNADALLAEFLAPLHVPRHPLLMARFGLRAMRSAEGLARRWFQGDLAPGLLAGMAGHSVLPLDQTPSAAVGLMFAVTAHAGGWPMPRGGSQKIAEALAGYLRSLGGEIVTGVHVTNLKELPPAKAVLLDVVPRHLSEIARDALPERFHRRLEKFRHGPGVFKIDWALDGPIPWRAAECGQAGTVHVGGTMAEVAAAERAAWTREPPRRPFVLVAQQSQFDPTRAPAGKHTAWGYCHVPAGSTFDMTERIESQLERFAPGFRDLVLARHVMTPNDFARYNPNYVGGDITGGVMDLGQIFTRPTARWVPYSTPAKNLFLCSSSTPPGAGVHGMCGYHAARAALRGVLRA